jgi:hypothetical protein
MVSRLLLAACTMAVFGFGGAVLATDRDKFDHEQHRKLFPSCENCHAGAIDSVRSFWPTPESCAECHDGTVEKRIQWSPPPTRPSNLRFTHAAHSRSAGKELAADSSLACVECHTKTGAAWMFVTRTLPDQCLDCHGIKAKHAAAPDSACATCHLTLAEATALPRERIAKFPKPVSHEESAFSEARGHGELAKKSTASCATCHAREYCTQCHVDAPENRPIQELAADPRSLAIAAELKAPASHTDRRFQARHGGMARRDATVCATCHTQESCLACHRAQPGVAARMPTAGGGRGRGAVIERKRPGTHVADFADRHGTLARSSPKPCSACHARAECLDCHRPNPGAAGTYHPAGFLTRHPTAAWSRQSDCSECHNQGAFCGTCHQQAGLVASRRLAGGYHDAQPSFLLNHGTAARQNLESCTTCHTERDCLTCHSVQGGRRFNPHGPGFNPDRLRRRNPQTCAACHGRAVPGN